jgi:hypothetical protein
MDVSRELGKSRLPDGAGWLGKARATNTIRTDHPVSCMQAARSNGAKRSAGRAPQSCTTATSNETERGCDVVRTAAVLVVAETVF